VVFARLMEGNLFLISLLRLITSILKSAGIGPRKIQAKKKNEQVLYQGCQCGTLCSRGLMEPHFFEVTLQGATVKQHHALCKQLFLMEECYIQQNGAPLCYHNEARKFLKVTFLARWTGRGERAKIDRVREKGSVSIAITR